MPPKQRFIPGLNSRPDDVEMPPKQPEKTDMDYLMEDFLKNKKNAAMCLHEYCQKEKLSLTFKEGTVQFRPGQPMTFGSFGCRAIVDAVQYPQGVGSNKKEAKIEASRLCLRAILEMDDFVPEEVTPEIDDNRYVEVRDLLDICATTGLLYEKMMNRDQKGVHTCTVYLSNQDPIKHSSADREEAVVIAHREAIRILQGNDATDDLTGLTDVEATAAIGQEGSASDGPRIPDPAIAQLREQEAYEALARTLQTLPPEIASYDHNIAAIFLSHERLPEYKGVGKIIAFGTGNATLGVEHLTPDGRCVTDSCATTVARRALKRYLGHEMVACFQGKPSIFEHNPGKPGRLRLQDGYEFHFFISHPPEGDYKQFLPFPSSCTQEELGDIARGAHIPNFTDDCHGLFRCQNEHGTVELSDQLSDTNSIQEVEAQGQIWVMTASDKLLSWNILGLQGAAYTHFIEPIYLKSINLGYNKCNDHGHLCRAVCCRVYPELAVGFPPAYRINHPVLSFSPSPEVRALSHPGSQWSPHSMNWSARDNKAEFTDCVTGRSNPESPFQVSVNPLSRQCKAGLHLKWFKDLCKCTGLPLADKNPVEIKTLASEFQSVKSAFSQHCVENGIGKWLHIPQGLWTCK